jgi:hypothetical protein
MAVLPPSLPNTGQECLAIVNISTTKIPDGRVRLGFENRHELEPLWFAADLMERAQDAFTSGVTRTDLYERDASRR